CNHRSLARTDFHSTGWLGQHRDCVNSFSGHCPPQDRRCIRRSRRDGHRNPIPDSSSIFVESWMDRPAITNRSSTWREKVVDYLSLERNVAIASAAVFLLGFGEELWKKFLPKYLEALGASTPIIGLFGTAEDFFDAIYQYPGGWIADYLGRRSAFLIFIALSSAGYFVYLFSSTWPLLFAALALVMAWQSM